MNLSQTKAKFRKALKNTVTEFIEISEFCEAAKLNCRSKQGNEETLYPFFYSILLKHLGCRVRGLGYGKIINGKEKIDCLCYFKKGDKPFGLELKGPSVDKSWVAKGVKKDINKLKTLVSAKVLSYGVIVGIYLMKSGKKPACGPVHVYPKAEIEDTDDAAIITIQSKW